MGKSEEVEPVSDYDLCGTGPYTPIRSHDGEFGWGVVHKKSGKLFALVGEKGCAHGLSAALNGHWEAAKTFMATEIRDSYFDRFSKRGE